jgi:hypothetical protein
MISCNFLHDESILIAISLGDIAPRLSPSKLVLIRDMIKANLSPLNKLNAASRPSVSATTCDNLEAYNKQYGRLAVVPLWWSFVPPPLTPRP